jgi:histidinol-phosphate aminotransferase
MKNYFNPAIAAMAGYVPGEQPKIANLIKLNTNENPYPPSPRVVEAMQKFDYARLRRYPDPMFDALRDAVAKRNGVKRENVVCGNGSDDILTMTFRAFTSPENPLACLWPTYSLYNILAEMQSAPVKHVLLDKETFAFPENALEQAEGANLFIITRPNAPTGNTVDKAVVREICAKFDGVVMFDEAYADFADDNCMDLAREFDNVLVSRTFSKSYSLAGIRMGYAVGHADLIDGLLKLKDSYNVDMIDQVVSLAAYEDEAYLLENCAKVKQFRAEMTADLRKIGFTVVDSQANFLFAAPPDHDGEGFFKFLRENAVLVRYFKGDVTGKYVRITLGTPEENARVLELARQRYGK